MSVNYLSRNDKLVSPGAESVITLQYNRCRVINRVVILQIQFSTNSAITSGTALITNLPQVGGNARPFLAMTNTADSTLYKLAIVTNSGESTSTITALSAIPANTSLRFNFVYYDLTP